LVPVIALTTPTDVSAGDILEAALALGLLVAMVVTVAAALSAALGRRLRDRRQGSSTPS
jgi:hypothetical protein